MGDSFTRLIVALTIIVPILVYTLFKIYRLIDTVDRPHPRIHEFPKVRALPKRPDPEPMWDHLLDEPDRPHGSAGFGDRPRRVPPPVIADEPCDCDCDPREA